MIITNYRLSYNNPYNSNRCQKKSYKFKKKSLLFFFQEGSIPFLARFQQKNKVQINNFQNMLANVQQEQTYPQQEANCFKKKIIWLLPTQSTLHHVLNMQNERKEEKNGSKRKRKHILKWVEAMVLPYGGNSNRCRHMTMIDVTFTSR